MPSFAVPFDRICLLRLSALGDLVQVWAVASAIRRAHPDISLTWIIGALGRQLFAAAQGIEFIEFDRKDGWAAYAKLKRQMPAQPYDLLLMMQPTLRANLMVPLIPARIKLGYDRARAHDLNWLFTNTRLEPAPRQHHAYNFWDFARALGCEPLPEDCRLPILEEARDAAANWLPDTDEGWVVIHPAASHPRRNWLPARYAALADHAAERGYRVALTGGTGASELALAQQITDFAGSPITNLAGKLSLQVLLGVLERAKLLIAPDTGPAHMAAACGTPVIGLYAASNPMCTGPLQSLDKVVDRYPQALQAVFGKSVAEVPWATRVKTGQVMALIEVDDVIRQFDRVLAG